MLQQRKHHFNCEIYTGIVSLHLRSLKSAQDKTLFQQSFERIIGHFADNRGPTIVE